MYLLRWLISLATALTLPVDLLYCIEPGPNTSQMDDQYLLPLLSRVHWNCQLQKPHVHHFINKLNYGHEAKAGNPKLSFYKNSEP